MIATQNLDVVVVLQFVTANAPTIADQERAEVKKSKKEVVVPATGATTRTMHAKLKDTSKKEPPARKKCKRKQERKQR